MSAGTSLQATIVSAVNGVEGITGIYDGPPARAPYPYVVVDAGTEFDWSHKTGAGREVAVAVTLWDEAPARMQQLADVIEDRVTSISAVDGWALTNLRFTRKRVVRDVAGPWAVALDFRARLLKSIEE